MAGGQHKLSRRAVLAGACAGWRYRFCVSVTATLSTGGRLFRLTQRREGAKGSEGCNAGGAVAAWRCFPSPPAELTPLRLCGLA
jgi:hypothetical protein